MVKVLIPKMVPAVKMLFARDVATVSTVVSMLVVLLCSSTMTHSVRARPSVAPLCAACPVGSQCAPLPGCPPVLYPARPSARVAPLRP